MNLVPNSKLTFLNSINKFIIHDAAKFFSEKIIN